MRTSTKFSEDIVPLSDMKVNPGRVVNQVDKTHRPVLLTSRGEALPLSNHLRITRRKLKNWRFCAAWYKA